MKAKLPKDELSELLGTSDRKAQAERVRRLLLAPVVELTIRLDARSNQVSYSVIGGGLPPAVAYEMLDEVRRQIHAAELEAARGYPGSPAMEPSPPETSPPAPLPKAERGEES